MSKPYFHPGEFARAEEEKKRRGELTFLRNKVEQLTNENAALREKSLAGNPCECSIGNGLMLSSVVEKLGKALCEEPGRAVFVEGLVEDAVRHIKENQHTHKELLSCLGVEGTTRELTDLVVKVVKYFACQPMEKFMGRGHSMECIQSIIKDIRRVK